jgi:predicted LPLAT superfamily acyltransferase
MSWNRTAEQGSVLGMRCVVLCLRVFGVRAARLVAEPIVLFYFLANGRARAASRDYLRRVAARPEGRRALGGEANAWRTWMHFRAFGRGLVDRAAFWAGLGERFTVDFPHSPEVLKLLEEKRGALLLGAHLGSIDVLRALAKGRGVPVNFLMFTDQAQKFNAVLRSIDPDLEFKVIAVEPGSVQFVLDLQSAVARGEYVALLGDRAELSSDKRVGRAEFLGSPAAFPLGPYWIAHLLECPVLLLFALHRGGLAYEVCLEPFAERILLDRGRRDQDLQAWLERYVHRLEAQCLATPLLWSNFYDFWRGAAASPAGDGRDPART